MAEKYRWIRVGWVVDYVSRALSDGTDMPDSWDMTIHVYLDFKTLRKTPFTDPVKFKTWVMDAKKTCKIDGKLNLASMSQRDRNRWMLSSPMGMEFSPPKSGKAANARFTSRIEADELYTDDSLADIERDWDTDKKKRSNCDAVKALIEHLNATAGVEVASLGDGSIEKVIYDSQPDYGAYGDFTC